MSDKKNIQPIKNFNLSLQTNLFYQILIIMKKVYLFAAMFAFTAITLTSCGGGEATTPETEVADTVAVEPAAETPAAVSIATLGDATKGEAVYNQVCMACHATGVAGAAKLDDKPRWEASAAKGFDVVKTNIIGGFTGEHGVMPPKGGRVDMADQDMIDALAYMFKASGVDFN
jgi:cytochrome c5